MRVLLAGAFGKLGSEILRALCKTDYEIIAAGTTIRIPEGIDEGRITTRAIDVTKPETLTGICKGVDTVITTVGLTGASTQFSNYDIDYKGNLNLLKEARRSKVKKFVYISVINADKGNGVPMVHNKYLFEQKLMTSGIDYMIYRPTGYFYDIAHVFWPMIKAKKVQLLKVKHEPVANVIAASDLARFILETMDQKNQILSVGGCETYTYREIAQMFYQVDGVKDGPVKTVPVFMMDILAHLPEIKKSGRTDIIRFSKFTLTNDCYGDVEIPGQSFREYIAEKSYAEAIEKEKGLC